MSARSKVFISYSHQDDKFLERLRVALRPLERQGRLDFWDDTRLVAGDDWSAEISQALDEALAAVVLVSSDLLASDFVVDHELPPILAAAAAGRLTVIPVFLQPSAVDDLEIPYRDAAGRQRHGKLTRFQGYGRPDRPLAAASWSDRERAFAELAIQLRKLSGERIPARKRRRGPVAGRAVTHEPAREYVLTVGLERRGDEIVAQYALPGSEPLDSASVPWTAIHGRLRAVSDAVDAGRLPSDEERAALFEVLFGPDSRWEPILRALFRRAEPKPRPNPPWAPVRLRIRCDDPLLLGLPWRLVTWRGRLLVQDGWTFTTTGVTDPADDHATTAPSSVLVVAPEDTEHPGAVVDLLKKVWPTGREAGYVRVVATREQLANALRGMSPHVLYFYGDAVGDSERPGVDELAKLFREAGHHPGVVWLNTRGAAEPGRLLTGVPLVIRRRLADWQDDSTTRALAWMRRWLGEGDDPIAALHEVTRDDVATSLEAATLAVHSSYRTWKTTTYRVVHHERTPHLRLDRDAQKALVAKHVSELARSDSRRVMALVAYADDGNTVAELSEQLRDHLDLAVYDLAEIDWYRLELPDVRARLRRDLEYEIQLQLGVDDNEPVRHLLRRYAPTVVGTTKRPIVWLDWGTFGSGLQEPLKPAELGAWLRFSSEFLGIHCPDDLRLVSYLAIETAVSKHKRLARTLQEHRREPWCRRPEFRLSVLPPLGRVSEDDLFDFLDDPQNSSCDPAIHAEIAERLIAETGGEFEATVALMKEAEQGSWYDLRTRLRRAQGAAEAVDDDEPL